MQIPQKLKITQKVELLETFLEFETSNKYEIQYENGDKFLFAFETSNLLWKLFAKKLRPCTIHLIDKNKYEHFALDRSFAFFFPEYKLYDEDKQFIGRIKKNFGFLQTKYTLYNQQNSEVARVEGPFWRPWTFNIKDENGQKIGLIGKKFSGLKELYSDADNFSFEVEDSVQNTDLRALILACTFAVDYDQFEN